MLAEISPDDPKKIQILEENLQYRYKDLVLGVPSAKWKTKPNRWLINKTWPTALALKNNLGDRLEVSDELAQWMNDEYSNKILPSYALRSEVSSDDGYEFLFPHQRADVQFLSTARRAILANGMGSGKAQPVSEPVLTPEGWVQMGDIQVGDHVVGKSGAPVEVLGVFPQGVRDIYKVSFKDGSFTYADGGHLWDVQHHKDVGLGRHRILTTLDMMNYGVKKTHPTYDAYMYRVPFVDPVEFPKKNLPIPAYAMGALLGDGHFSDTISLTSADAEISDRVISELSNLVNTRESHRESNGLAKTFHFTRKDASKKNPLKRIINDLGLSNTKSDKKFIPNVYLYSSIEDRIDLLRGLMDTDGTVGTPKGTGEHGTVSFCSVSLELAYGVREVVQSLGGTAVWNYHKRPKLGNFDPVVITIKLPSEINPFFMKRKAQYVPKNDKYKLARLISGIEFSHREEAQCIYVDSEDHLYVTRDYIVTHNTISATTTLRHMAENMGEDALPVLVVCPASTKYGWAKEIEKAWPGRKTVVIDGSAAKRRKQFKEFMEEGGEFLIMNWESVRSHSRLKAYGSISLTKCTECGGLDPKVTETKCETHDKELNMIEFGAVIGDEIHRIADPKTKASRSFKYATGDADIRIGLSGTPILSTPDDLFSALNWLYPEGYPSKTAYIDRYCDVSDNYWGGQTVTGVKKHVEQEFFAGIDPILRRMPKEVILPFLPPIVRSRRDVEMGAKQAKAYKQMKEEMIAMIEDDDVVFTTNPLTQTMRLLQFASAFGKMEDVEVMDPNSPIPMAKTTERKLTLTDPSCKLDAFMEDLPDFGDSSVVVFSSSKQLIRLLSTRLDKAEINYGLITGDQDAMEREAYMEAFQAGDIKLILITVQAGGTGITLTKADTMVFLNRSWSMIENQQAEGRAHRIGSEIHDQIQIIDYVTKDTIEDVVFEAIDRKVDNLEFLLRDKDLIKRAMDADSSVVDSTETE